MLACGPGVSNNEANYLGKFEEELVQNQHRLLSHVCFTAAKTFSLRYSPTIENRSVGSLQMIERNGENLIAAESFKRTIAKGTTLYIKLIEVRGYVVNKSIRTDKKFYRLGKLFKF